MFQQPYNYYPQYNMNAQQRLQQMEQQYPQFAQQSQPVQPTQNVTWIPVSGMQGAKEHIVQPGQTAWMMDNNAPMFYVKSADQMGTATFKAYRFEEVSTDLAHTEQPAFNPEHYVKREEFDQLKKILDQIVGSNKTIAEPVAMEG